jgi:hypothetical protein
MGEVIPMSSSNTAQPAGEQAEPQELALPEIIKQYKGKWVAISVTGRDKNFQPTKGKVVADDLDRYLLRMKLKKFQDICIFFAGEPPYPLLL